MYEARYFKPSELTCRCGCGYNESNELLLMALDDIRQAVNQPLIVESGCRCVAHNEAIKGRPFSKHLLGEAADLRCKDSQLRYKLLEAAIAHPFIRRIGVGRSFIHVDVGQTIKEVLWSY